MYIGDIGRHDSAKTMQASVHATTRIGKSARAASFKEDQLADRPGRARTNMDIQEDGVFQKFSEMIPR